MLCDRAAAPARPSPTRSGAVIAGDALGNLLPLGPARQRADQGGVRPAGSMPLGPAVTALAIENVLYTLSVAAMIAAGMAALLFVFDMPLALREISEVAIGGVVVAFAAGARAAVDAAGARQPRRRGACCPGSATAQRRVERLRDAGGADLHLREPARRAAGADCRRRGRSSTRSGCSRRTSRSGCSSARRRLPHCLHRRSGEPAADVVFKFVPLQMGVSEAGIAFLTGMLGLGTTAGHHARPGAKSADAVLDGRRHRAPGEARADRKQRARGPAAEQGRGLAAAYVATMYATAGDWRTCRPARDVTGACSWHAKDASASRRLPSPCAS